MSPVQRSGNNKDLRRRVEASQTDDERAGRGLATQSRPGLTERGRRLTFFPPHGTVSRSQAGVGALLPVVEQWGAMREEEGMYAASGDARSTARELRKGS